MSFRLSAQAEGSVEAVRGDLKRYFRSNTIFVVELLNNRQPKGFALEISSPKGCGNDEKEVILEFLKKFGVLD